MSIVTGPLEFVSTIPNPGTPGAGFAQFGCFGADATLAFIPSPGEAPGGVLYVYGTSDGWLSSTLLQTIVSPGPGAFSSSISCSSDGTKVLISSNTTQYVAESSNNWASFALQTVGSVAAAGQQMSMSRDGNIVALGNPADGGGAGSIAVLRRGAGGAYSTVATFSGDAAADSFGQSSVLSSDGTGMVVTAPGGNYLRHYSAADQASWASASVRQHTPPPNVSSAGVVIVGAANDLSRVAMAAAVMLTTEPVIVSSDDGWQTIEFITGFVIPAGGMGGALTGGGMDNIGRTLLMGTAEPTADVATYPNGTIGKLFVFESQDGNVTYPETKVIELVTVPEVTNTFSPSVLFFFSEGLDFLLVGDPSNNRFFVFRRVVIFPPEEQVVEAVQIGGSDPVVGGPPRDGLFTAVQPTLLPGPARDLARPPLDRQFSVLQVGQPSPVIGGVPRDGTWRHLSAGRIV